MTKAMATCYWVRMCPRYIKGTILGFLKNYVHTSVLAIPETICQFPNRRPGPTSFKTLGFRLNSFALLNWLQIFLPPVNKSTLYSLLKSLVRLNNASKKDFLPGLTAWFYKPG